MVSAEFIFRLVGMAVLAVVGYQLGDFVAGPTALRTPSANTTVFSLAFAGAALGLLLTPYLTVRPFLWIREEMRRLPANVLVAGTVGMVIGLAISVLLAFPLSMLPGELGKWLPLGVAVFCAYAGISVMVMRQQEMLQAVGSFLPSGMMSQSALSPAGGHQLIVDTSTIIDGRIADISQTGFLQGTLIIPSFVLDELRHIADSPEALRRNRGRRGLEMLNKLQKDAQVPVQVSDMDFEDTIEVDVKLVQLAKLLRAPIITNDYNLNRVAELQGVRALNINELANAVKSVVLPGEEMHVRVIQEGKEIGQGVGFLDDGTMVVIENGRRYLGQQITVAVTRVLQTVAGRMIFAQPRVEAEVTHPRS